MRESPARSALAEEAAPEVSGTERSQFMGERLVAVRKLVRAAGGRAVLLDRRRDIAWLTVGAQHHVVLASEAAVAPLLVTADSCYALAPVNEAARIADEELAGLPVEVVSLPWHEPTAVASEATRLGDGAVLSADELGQHLLAVRSRLAPPEHDRMRWLARQLDARMSATLQTLEANMTEDDVAAAMAAELARSGVRVPVLLVAADERIERYRHPLPQGRPVKRRLMLVAVAERWGLHVAATRFRELEPPAPDLQARIGACAEILAAMRAATRPGRTMGEVMAAAIAAYGRSGFPDEWRLHHQGGSIGYAGRERIATPDDATTIQVDMAFAWNPSIRGAKAEATDLLRDDGLETLIG
ncbi:MAG: M24 family metallopeptidase [Chloroflexi bacterium]|nr:M24 family metallopeptidase [Chloroflexota bacterium]